MDITRIALAVVGLLIVVMSFYWAARIMMVKGADPPYFARLIVRTCRNALHFTGNLMSDPNKRHELWSLYIPVSLLAILAWSIVLATLGYTLLLYGVTENSISTAYENSVSSMSTLGIAGEPKTLLEATIGGIEAFTGPTFVALLVAYMVSVFSAYSKHRDRLDKGDELLAGNENGADLLVSSMRAGGLDSLDAIWSLWIDEFKDLERTYHSVDGYLLLFAPNMSHHWSADSPMVLDAAALRNSLVAGDPDDKAASCLALGSIAFAHLAKHYRHRVISLRMHKERPAIDRLQFDSCAQELSAAGIAVATDLDQAWEQFDALRQRYWPQVALLTRLIPSNIES